MLLFTSSTCSGCSPIPTTEIADSVPWNACNTYVPSRKPPVVSISKLIIPEESTLIVRVKTSVPIGSSRINEIALLDIAVPLNAIVSPIS